MVGVDRFELPTFWSQTRRATSCAIPRGGAICIYVFLLLGEGGTGKSVYAHILRELVGEANSCATQLSEMGDRFNAIELTKKHRNLVETAKDIISTMIMAPRPGFEPGLPDLESGVLDL